MPLYMREQIFFKKILFILPTSRIAMMGLERTHFVFEKTGYPFFLISKTHKKLTNSHFFIEIGQVKESFFIYLKRKSAFFKKVLTWGVFPLYYASSFLHVTVEKIHCSFT